MANNKLQELTERLYSEGLSKGRQEGEQLLAKAREEAASIVENARVQAQKTIDEASRKAADIAAKAASDVKMASFQALEATKGDITAAVEARIVTETVEGLLGKEEFIRQIIMEAAKKVSTEGACDLSIVLPESAGGSLEQFTVTEVSRAIGKGIDVTMSKKIKGGLRIGPRDGGYFIDLSDETFNSLICEYLRPATRKVLFGE